jgi:hypothetical protein
VRIRSALIWMVVCAGLGAAACGGDEVPAAGTPAVEPAAPPVAEPTVEEQVPVDQMQLVREVFSYQGAGRDPFASLLRSADVRPLIEDLRVTVINVDPRYPGASIAVLRDTTLNQRYTVRVGDELGRMRVVDINADEVMVLIEEFGVERQMSIRLRRRQEETQ